MAMLIKEGHEVPKDVLDQMGISVADRSRHVVVEKLLSRFVSSKSFAFYFVCCLERNCSSVIVLNNAKHVVCCKNNADRYVHTSVCVFACSSLLSVCSCHLLLQIQ